MFKEYEIGSSNLKKYLWITSVKVVKHYKIVINGELRVGCFYEIVCLSSFVKSYIKRQLLQINKMMSFIHMNIYYLFKDEETQKIN